MRYSFRSTATTDDRLVTLAQELNPPRPFTLNGLRSSLEQQCQHPVHMISTVMAPGAPSGVWLRSSRADYLFLEEETSAFHQAHIACTLAAHMLLSRTSEGRIDRPLMRNVDPRPGRMIPGIQIDSSASRPEAETFAFEVLRQGLTFPGRLRARLLLRRLRPLRSDLLAAVPSAGARPLALADPASRLYWAVIEIWDAALALRPYGAARVPEGAPMRVALGQFADQSLNAAVEAASAVRNLSIAAVADRKDGGVPVAASRPDLCVEAVRLAEAAETLAR